MAYKTPAQMADLVMDENLFLDACVTIVTGRNDYGFKATKIPPNMIEKTEDWKYNAIFGTADGEIVRVPLVPPKGSEGKEIDFWVVSFKEGKQEIFGIAHNPVDESPFDTERRAYLAAMALFFDKYRIGTKMRLMTILERGYEILKKENGEVNDYKLMRDAKIDAAKAEYVRQLMAQTPGKVNLRLNFMDGQTPATAD